MKAPVKWKSLQPHPRAAEYPDWPKDLHDKVVATLKEHGNVDDRRIMLCQHLILDGVQFHRACVEADVKPPFSNWNGPPELYVEIKNDHRRHESQDAMVARAAKRRASVSDPANAALSNRALGDKLGVSETTIRRDRAALPGATPGAPEHEESPTPSENLPKNVIGRDGKSYSTTPPKQRKPGSVVFDLKTWEKSYGGLVLPLVELTKAHPMEDFDELEMDLKEWFGRFRSSLERVGLMRKESA